MTNRYLPMTEQDQAEMLAAIGAETIEDLFSDIPEEIRFKGELPVSSKLDEYALTRHMTRLAGRNVNADTHASFLGAGIYDHHVPSVINHVISRSEFYTAYTPYQPEISQGELQAIFEFQSYICELTGMAVANASMYDGATAFAEAGNLAAAATRRKKLVVSSTVHPESRQVLASYAHGLNLEIVEIGYQNGVTDMEALAAAISEDTAAVMIQSPNFFGSVEDIQAAADLIHPNKGLLIVSANPISLGLLEAPGKLGADIVVGDAQPLGIAGSYGGPTCGYFAVSQAHMRRIPGRIVGQTTDRYGRRGFVLTLQAREQHIRREKATSNICSNQALLALSASVYMSLLGKQGMLDVSELNLQKSHYAKQTLASIEGVSTPFTSPTFNEFVIKLPDHTSMEDVQSKLLAAGFIGGYDLGREYPELSGHMLIAVTERRSKEEIDEFKAVLEGLL
ncbi:MULTISPECIES: aminomethyl-transferring glycine dehydrogenase subunit GcvPA [unclassified Paenibacillus]|uniref:aminomethyl-transferring glycine dehydrogenase subunit GcvPA n=1 Tax=unclassified Paenibacillus TaxID=185978 RepID=UPI0008965BCE|nr:MULTISPECIES: aminomethyl-transferring glycine dehydrogenase subunit GcvPA [unclassified Paenibacillus]OMC69177.1 glycine dehydrogenase (aminomethyl-transferring) [Paenibacillus sp. FSL H7-0326]SDX02373.1 glycine dehydrogenase subunit 1 [Paenibacillus sp. PDC88]